MSLARFILGNLESIMDDWDAFAHQLPGGDALDLAGLRDHAESILRAIAADMDSAQSVQQQFDKSRGQGARISARATSAEEHATDRFDQGFDLNALVAEYRALRASVVRHWAAAVAPLAGDELTDLVRFDEAIDQALAESVARFTAEVDHARAEARRRRTIESDALRASEARLRASEHTLRAIIEQLPVGVGVSDRDGRFILSNAVMQRLALRHIPSRDPDAHGRWRALDAQGRDLPPDQWPGARALRGESVEPGVLFTFTDDEGTEQQQLVSAKPFRDETGAVIGAIAVSQDLTERRRAEHEVEMLLDRLTRLTDNTPLAVIEWDADFRITRWSGQAEHMFGWTASEAVGRSMDELSLVHRDDVGAVRQICERLVEPDNPFVVSRNRNTTRTGAVVTCDWYNSVLREDDGRMVAVLSLVLDVTEPQRVMEALRDADRRKDEFLATLAHELRNPLAPIRQAAAVGRSAAATPAQVQWSLEVIERQAKHMGLLLDDLLDVARITGGRLELNPATLSVGEIVDAAVETARPHIEARRHALQVSLPEKPLRLDGDPLRLAQVLTNLLTNAAKYTEPGGSIRLSARRDGESVEIAVADNGIGIPPDQLDRVFEMFAQGRAPSHLKSGGLGIGLALSRGLVALHRGTLEARSRGPGQGATFVVRLPLHPETIERPPQAAHVPAGVRRSRRILVVDDNDDAGESLAALLRLREHDVRVAGSGEDALRAAADFGPEVVLLDLGMPEIDGLEVARRLRSGEAGRGTLLVAVTGWGQPEDRRRTQAAGFDHHLTKPVDPETLADIIEVDPQPASRARKR